MLTPDLLSFVKINRGQGMSDEQIRAALKAQGGWNDADINEAFTSVAATSPAPAPAAPQPASPLMADLPSQFMPNQGARTQQTAPIQQAVMRPSQPAPAPAPKRRSGLVKAAITLILVAILGVGGYFAYANYIYPRFALSPETILAMAAEKITEVHSAGYDLSANVKFGQISGTGTSSPIGNGTFSFHMKGASDISKSDDTKLDTNVDIALDTSGSDLGIKTGVNIDVRILDKNGYIKFNRLPNLGIIDLSDLPIKDIWMFVPDVFKDDATNTDNSLAKDFGVPLDADSITGGAKLPKDLSREKVLEIYKKHKIFTIDHFENAKAEDGTPVYHYDLAFNKDQFIGFSDEILDEAAKGSTTTPEEVAKSKKDVRDLMDQIAKATISIDVGKVDTLLYGLNATIRAEDKQQNVFADITINGKMRDFNKEVNVAVPSPVKTVDELSKIISDYMTAKYSQSAPKAPVR